MIKVDLNNIFEKEEDNQKHKVNYFDDYVITTDAQGAYVEQNYKEIYNHELSIDNSETLKAKDEKNGKNDLIHKKIDIQHCEIDLFSDNLKKNENFHIILSKTDKDLLGSYDIIKTSTHLFPVLDNNLDFNIENPIKSSIESKFHNNSNYFNDTNVNDMINFCNKSLEPKNRENNTNEIQNNQQILITNNYNDTFNNFNFSKVSHPMNTNANLATNPNAHDHDYTNKNLVTSYNNIKTEFNNILIEDNEIISKANDNPRVTFQIMEESPPVLSAEINLFEENNCEILDTKNLNTYKNVLSLETQKNLLSMETVATKQSKNRKSLFEQQFTKPKINKVSSIKTSKNIYSQPVYNYKPRMIKSPDLKGKYNNLLLGVQGYKSPLKNKKTQDTKQNLNKSDNNQIKVIPEMRLDSVQLDEIITTLGKADNDKKILFKVNLQKKEGNTAFSPKANRSRQTSIKYNDKGSFINNPHLLINKIENKFQKVRKSIKQLKDINVPRKSYLQNTLSSPKVAINLSRAKILTPTHESNKKEVFLWRKKQIKVAVGKKISIKRNSISENDYTNEHPTSTKSNARIEDKRLNSNKNN